MKVIDSKKNNLINEDITKLQNSNLNIKSKKFKIKKNYSYK